MTSVAAVAYHFCLNFPEKVSQSGNGNLAQLCIEQIDLTVRNLMHFAFLPPAAFPPKSVLHVCSEEGEKIKLETQIYLRRCAMN